MDSILRALAIYVMLMLVFRIAGKRTLAHLTSFDFVLLLVVGEATQQALLGDDFSVTNAFLVIVTLIGTDVGLSLLKRRWPRVERLIDSVPLVILEDGKLFRDRMEKARVDEADILTAARQLHGIARMEQIKYAVLERSGGISIIPR
jgi:uncharacterized membrane protein YcaP (DUF421 family)